MGPKTRSLIASDQITVSTCPDVDLARVLMEANLQYFAHRESSGCLDGRSRGRGVCAMTDLVSLTEFGQQVAEYDLVGR